MLTTNAQLVHPDPQVPRVKTECPVRRVLMANLACPLPMCSNRHPMLLASTALTDPWDHLELKDVPVHVVCAVPMVALECLVAMDSQVNQARWVHQERVARTDPPVPQAQRETMAAQPLDDQDRKATAVIRVLRERKANLARMQLQVLLDPLDQTGVQDCREPKEKPVKLAQLVTRDCQARMPTTVRARNVAEAVHQW
jgi:hypothetical protein